MIIEYVNAAPSSETIESLNLYENSSKVSFTDCVILKQIHNFGPDEFLKFDENLKKAYSKV